MPPPPLPPPPLALHILSDLHLETPLPTPSYSTFTFPLPTTHLCLLGDIGLATHPALFAFLRHTLLRSPTLHILYLLGNHECYDLTHTAAIAIFRQFESEVEADARFGAGKRFHLLERGRVDFGNVTVLGCTLWSRVREEVAAEVGMRMTDFKRIKDWDLDALATAHAADLQWLNEEVKRIEVEEPERSIVILTHHAPTTLPPSTTPWRSISHMFSAFQTDLSREPCWTSPLVALWAYGHTHYSCSFHDPDTGKLVYSNQRGYSGTEGEEWSVERYLEAGNSGRWEVREGIVKVADCDGREGGGERKKKKRGGCVVS